MHGMDGMDGQISSGRLAVGLNQRNATCHAIGPPAAAQSSSTSYVVRRERK